MDNEGNSPAHSEQTMLTGFMSVDAVLKSSSREIYRIFLEAQRFEKVRRSDFRAAEKAQYARIFDYSKKNNVPVEFCNEAFFEPYSKTSGGIAALVSERVFTDENKLYEKPSPFFAYLEGIEDPFNFGYVLRSLYLAGCDGVFLPPRNFFTASDTVVRSSAGASEIMNVAVVQDAGAMCSSLKDKGVKIICTGSGNDSVPVTSEHLKRPLLLVIGGEKRGISRNVLTYADALVRIDYAVRSNIALPASSAACLLAFGVMNSGS